MDPRWLHHYRANLRHLREDALRFAARHPDLAARLAMSGMGTTEDAVCPDPQIERLLEGVAFLSARVDLERERQHAPWAEHLIDRLYPGFLDPAPAMAVLRLQPALDDPALAVGPVLPAGRLLESPAGPPEGTPEAWARAWPPGLRCRFRTAHAVRLWPLQIEGLRWWPPGAMAGQAGAALSLDLRWTADGGRWPSDIPFLDLHCAGPIDPASWLHAQLTGPQVHVQLQDPQRGFRPLDGPARPTLQARGLADDEALLPAAERSWVACRLLREYAALPARLLFLRLQGLQAAGFHCQGPRLRVLFLGLRAAMPPSGTLAPDALQLHCTPAINLFEGRGARIALRPDQHEYALQPLAAAADGAQVHSVRSMSGLDAAGAAIDRPLLPHARAGARGAWFYAVRRQPWQRPGPRMPGQPGHRLLISVAEPSPGLWPARLAQLSPGLWLTQGEWPGHLGPGGGWQLVGEPRLPVQEVQLLCRPSRPGPLHADGALHWRLLAHLTLNARPWMSGDAAAAQRLDDWRAWFALHDAGAQGPLHQAAAALVALDVTSLQGRLPGPGPLVFGEGVCVRLTVDESAWPVGTGAAAAVLLGALLDHIVARHVSVHALSRFELAGLQSGVLRAWPLRRGGQALA